MKRYVVTITFAALCVPALARAETGTWLNAYHHVHVNAPAAEVWQRIGEFGALSEWHPEIDTTNADPAKGNTIGSKRRVQLSDVGVAWQELTAHDPQTKSYRYKIVTEHAAPFRDYSAVISVFEPTPGNATVVWRSRFIAKEQGDASTNDAKLIAAVEQLYATGLDNLKRQIEKP